MPVPQRPQARSDVGSRRGGARPAGGAPRRGRPVTNAVIGGGVAALILAAVVVPAANARDAATAARGLAVDDGAARVTAVAAAGVDAAAPASRGSALTAGSTAGAASVADRAAPAGKGPVPATRSRQAQRVPAYPRDGRTGRRIVYDKALMHVWLVDARNRVVARFPVTGRWDRPAKGVYRVYGTSPDSMNTHSQVTFRHMVRFAWGTKDETASIGFHSIPIYYARHVDRDGEVHAQGSRMTTRAQLGLPIATGGCVRMADEDAAFLYDWARLGDTVVVLPSP